jgi:hypothetical protein
MERRKDHSRRGRGSELTKKKKTRASERREVPGRGLVDQPVEYEWLPSITGFPA